MTHDSTRTHQQRLFTRRGHGGQRRSARQIVGSRAWRRRAHHGKFLGPPAIAHCAIRGNAALPSYWILLESVCNGRPLWPPGVESSKTEHIPVDLIANTLLFVSLGSGGAHSTSPHWGVRPLYQWRPLRPPLNNRPACENSGLSHSRKWVTVCNDQSFNGPNE